MCKTVAGKTRNIAVERASVTGCDAVCASQFVSGKPIRTP